MKFNGNFIKAFSGTDLYKGVRTKKKTKTEKPPRKKRLENINPVFTFHSLQRLSERLCNKYIKPSRVIIGKYIVPCSLAGGWIPPRMINDCIDDIKHSMYDEVLYSEERDSFAIKGRKAIYIISRQHEIITIYKEFDKEEKKKYRHVAQRDTLIFFGL